MAIIKKEFIAENMTCTACEKIIERQAHKVKGVRHFVVDYVTGEGVVTFDDKKTDIDKILDSIEEKGYECSILERGNDIKADKEKSSSNGYGWIIALIGIIIIGYFLLESASKIALPEITPSMGLWLIFVVGLLTGFHCIAMCGGFVVSYTANAAKEGKSTLKSHLIYGASKTLSYTIIGAVFGFIGSIIAFTPFMRGIAGIIAGVFLLIFGLNMLNLFPSLRKFRLKTPAFFNKFLGEKHEKYSSNPMIIGLLNGLMIACGPLQAIYILAAGTGSAIEGAKFLFVFGLGTLPVMLSFGYLTSFISSKATHKILKASGIIIIILGILMLNNGLALSGSGYDFKTLTERITLKNSYVGNNIENAPESKNVAVLKDGYQEIYMDVTARGYSPDKFILKKGVPVRWIINGKELTSCNNAIQVPKYKLQFKIKSGEQTIEFTPNELGVVSWSCWMGMIPGTFIVTDDITSAQAQTQINSVPTQKTGGSCGMGCGCGMNR